MQDKQLETALALPSDANAEAAVDNICDGLGSKSTSSSLKMLPACSQLRFPSLVGSFGRQGFSRSLVPFSLVCSIMAEA